MIQIRAHKLRPRTRGKATSRATTGLTQYEKSLQVKNCEDADIDDGTTGQQHQIYSVSKLNSEVRWLLEDRYPEIWVEGELSNFAQPRSGHMYFTLKDQSAQLRSAMFSSENRLLEFSPANGLQVLARGRLSLYRERGEYQMVVGYMELAGAGALRRRFEQLRVKLVKEGLFDSDKKRPLPKFPRRIGIVTSPTGAAMHDVLEILHRRFPSLPVVLYPTRVQGEGSAQEIAQMIAVADRRAECDILLLVRGGGSLEDLWAFNEEPVARAIHHAEIPIVAGIGHETDTTLADFAADVRAPTPSAAAELASPNGSELSERLSIIHQRLIRRIQADVTLERRTLSRTFARLRHPRRHLESLAQRNDDASLRLLRCIEARFPRERDRLATLQARMGSAGPCQAIQSNRLRLASSRETLSRQLQHRVETRQTSLTGLLRALEAVSPERTLERGYAIVHNDANGEVLRESVAVSPGTIVRAQLAKGALICEVESLVKPRA